MSDKGVEANRAGLARRFHDWMVSHDESMIFVALYVGLAVVLSIWISLFWLVVVVGGHFLLEVIRQRAHHDGAQRVALEVAWELKLDVALVLFALALALYMDLILGVLGLQSAARTAGALKAGARTGGKAVVWERVIRGILLSLDDLAQVARSFGARKKGDVAVATPELKAEEPPAPGASSWSGRWGLGDRIALGLGVVCLALIFGSPLLTQHDPGSVVTTLMMELQPFPGADGDGR